MADPDVLSQILGPQGALVGAAVAAGILWRRHVKDDDVRDAASAEEKSYERERTKRAEDRLESLGATMKAATDVMERAVDLAEKVVDHDSGDARGDRRDRR